MNKESLLQRITSIELLLEFAGADDGVDVSGLSLAGELDGVHALRRQVVEAVDRPYWVRMCH